MTRAKGPKYVIPFKRRRKKVTDYRKRLGFLKSGKTRMVVRKSNKRIIVEMIAYNPKGDDTLVNVDSNKLKKLGWYCSTNIPTAYLTGYLCGVEALKKNIKEFVLDIGMITPTKGSVVFAVLKGAVDAGLKTQFDSKIINDKRLDGSHIADYAKSLKESDKTRYNKLFSKYVKEGVDPEKLPELFEKTKQQIR
ncbi:50S ribosomal protein L18 [Candidatus Micrarchaeota archaeon]|nr:50S ribosomal protein L18 [Candidatus Micrarchaeota archaeon]